MTLERQTVEVKVLDSLALIVALVIYQQLIGKVKVRERHVKLIVNNVNGDGWNITRQIIGKCHND